MYLCCEGVRFLVAVMMRLLMLLLLSSFIHVDYEWLIAEGSRWISLSLPLFFLSLSGFFSPGNMSNFIVMIIIIVVIVAVLFWKEEITATRLRNEKNDR